MTPPTLVREYLLLLAVGPLSLRDASPVSESSPLSLGRFWGRRPFVPPVAAIARGRRPLTRREVVSGPATLGVPTPRLLGDSKEWSCLSSRPCYRVAVGTQSLWDSQPPLSGRSLGRRPSVLGYSLPAWDCQVHSLFKTTVPADGMYQESQRGRYRLDCGVAHSLCLDHVADKEDASWRKTMHHMRSFVGAKPLALSGALATRATTLPNVHSVHSWIFSHGHVSGYQEQKSCTRNWNALTNLCRNVRAAYS